MGEWALLYSVNLLHCRLLVILQFLSLSLSLSQDLVGLAGTLVCLYVYDVLAFIEI